MKTLFTPSLRTGEFYVAPDVTVLEITVERGFAESDYSNLELPDYNVVEEEKW